MQQNPIRGTAPVTAGIGADPPEAADATLRVSEIVGRRLDPNLHERLPRLERRGVLDSVEIGAPAGPRRRCRATSQAGRTVEIALPREQALFDGAVLWLAEDAGLLLRVAAQQWLRLVPRTRDDALMLGYHAGNLHWRVRFEDGALLVALEAPPEDYLARLGPLAAPGRLDCGIIDAVPC